MHDKLDEMFELQRNLMSRLQVGTVQDEFEETLTKHTVYTSTALVDEVHEFLRELNWKPWKKTRKEVDMARVHDELADCWHFLIELSLMWGLNEQKIIEAFRNKNKVNHKRQDGGY